MKQTRSGGPFANWSAVGIPTQVEHSPIGVIFEKENINTLTESSEYLITLFSGFAQAESESISKNVI